MSPRPKPTQVAVVTDDKSPAERRRTQWGENLAEHLTARNLTVKTFHRALLEENVDISTQAIYSWLKGDTAPRPETQVAIAKILFTRPHILFPAAAA